MDGPFRANKVGGGRRINGLLIRKSMGSTKQGEGGGFGDGTMVGGGRETFTGAIKSKLFLSLQFAYSFYCI